MVTFPHPNKGRRIVRIVQFPQFGGFLLHGSCTYFSICILSESHPAILKKKPSSREIMGKDSSKVYRFHAIKKKKNTCIYTPPNSSHPQLLLLGKGGSIFCHGIVRRLLRQKNTEWFDNEAPVSRAATANMEHHLKRQVLPGRG